MMSCAKKLNISVPWCPDLLKRKGFSLQVNNPHTIIVTGLKEQFSNFAKIKTAL
ncbi:hypothetical protein ACFOG5_19180 [Pedobacter fastidiosus]|uniref:hypothetical protein n=1 Tax=Pedobacter fastidiosus TaxID=2765361 RepID=UPI0036170215